MLPIKIYIAGKITGLDNYKKLFNDAEDELVRMGHNVMNPSVLPPGFEHGEYMRVCYSMIDVCEAVYFLENWTESVGAKMECEYAIKHNKMIMNV